MSDRDKDALVERALGVVVFTALCLAAYLGLYL